MPFPPAISVGLGIKVLREHEQSVSTIVFPLPVDVLRPLLDKR